MPKKTHKSHPKTRKSNKALHITLIIFGMFVLSLVAAVFFQPWVHGNAQCANTLTCATDLSGKPTNDTEGVFLGKTVQVPEIPTTETYALEEARRVVLGDTTADKHIYVDITNQRLHAFEGSTEYMNVPVSTGKWNPTPTGDFQIWVWLRATRMSGGSGADYYNLPNVPYTMFFYNGQTPKSWGYSLHGAYWHNNFGHPMSHGCVNMRIPDAEKLYYWSNPNIKSWTTYATADYPGPTITIYGTTPLE